jgi:PAS domain-containing protein
MTSMTNITEAKRIRDQLSASHERFTTVLEGLDAAVSVLSVQQGELLFANRSYRQWFGADARGHDLLASGDAAYTEVPEDDVDAMSGLPTQELTEVGTHPREVYVESLQMWFDVRSRYLQWTDGRLAQMLIATDITARRRAEEQAQQQAERAQVTSRLITMGEMASSVAHELNQPLTAITNYCNGMVSRVRNNAINTEELLAALEKTARQAERAGQIIQRIRAFVKKSEPQRQAAKARTSSRTRWSWPASSCAAARWPSTPTWPSACRCCGGPDPDRAGADEPAEERGRGHRHRPDAGRAPPHRAAVVPRQSPDEGSVIEFSVTDAGPACARK